MTELATVDAAHGALSPVVDERWLAVEWPEPQSVLSWAVVGGGRARARRVVWRRVGERELRPPVDFRRFLRAEMTSAGYTDGVGLLTARRLDTAVDVTRHFGALSARCVTGTGTDCLVIAAPEAHRWATYAGKHTAIGHLVGAAVCEAITRGAALWLSEQVQGRQAVSR
jgi:adenosylcobinamide amidohydrolase